MKPEAGARSQRYQALARLFQGPGPNAPDDLRQAYTRLFLGPGRAIAHPYESVYRHGQLSGESAFQVARTYAEAGLQVSQNTELPDHISFELAFMAHLAAQEESHPNEADRWRARQRRFLTEHLGRWLPEFSRRVELSQTHPIYVEAAERARRLVEEDLARLASPEDFRPHSSPSPTDSLDQPDARLPAPTRQPRRFPNLHLRMDASRCTLCSLCTDACRLGALAVECTSDTIYVVFDQARCNGCRECLRICPEKAIAIARGPAQFTPARSSMTRLVTASRVVCPACYQPHIAKPWLERLAVRLGDSASVRQSLALCPICKASSTQENKLPARLPQESSTGA